MAIKKARRIKKGASHWEGYSPEDKRQYDLQFGAKKHKRDK